MDDDDVSPVETKTTSSLFSSMTTPLTSRWAEVSTSYVSLKGLLDRLLCFGRCSTVHGSRLLCCCVAVLLLAVQAHLRGEKRTCTDRVPAILHGSCVNVA